MDVPMEYTNTHVRRQLVVFMAEHADYFLPAVQTVLRNTYGTGELSHGPFSFRTYLLALLSRQFWADEIVINALSVMWQLPVSIIYGKSLAEIKIRHTREDLRKVDIVLIYTGQSHYSPAGK